MAPQELVGRYKEYKTKTKNLLFWITKTAGACCDLSKIIKSLAGDKKTGRKADRPTAHHVAELEISTQELLELAKRISAAIPPVEVPEGIVLIIEDVIVERERAAAWYANQALKGDSKMAKENESHQHFIKILKDVLEVLKGARAEQASTSKPPPSKNAKGKKKNKKTAESDVQALIGSLFESLDLEEPVANPLGDAPLPASATTPPVRPDFILQKHNDDHAFKTWCFLQDLADVRCSIMKIWDEYAKGEVSFLAASIFTDTAFGLLRRADDEFVHMSPFGSTDWAQLMEYLGIGYFLSSDAVWLHPSQDRRTREPKSDSNIVQLLCPVAFYCLRSWQADAEAYCEGEKRLRRGDGDGLVKPGGQRRLHGICNVFFSNIVELHSYAHCPPKNGARDEFIKALVDIHKSGVIPVWAVIACQTYMDMLDMLGFHAWHGVEVLREKSALIQKLYADVEAYNPAGDWTHPDVRSAMDKFRHLHKRCLFEDRMIKLPSELPTAPQTVEEARARNYRGPDGTMLPANFPAYAGTLLAEDELTFYDISIAFASHGNNVLKVAHLYRALQAMGLLDHTWHDLEHAISSFSPRDPLVAKVEPSFDGDKAQTNFLMAIGVGLTDLSGPAVQKAKQEGKFKADLRTRKNPAAIEISSPLLEALCDRATIDRSSSNTKTFEAVLRALRVSEETTVKSQKSQRKVSRLPPLTACELLATLRKRLLHDEPTVYFDYIGLTLDCTRLLDTLATRLGTFESDGFGNQEVQSLLMSGPANPACHEAASILRSLIVADGKRYVKRAFDQSSGRIPKHLRPEVQADRDAVHSANQSTRNTLEEFGIKYCMTGTTIAAYHTEFDPGHKSERFSQQSPVTAVDSFRNLIVNCFEIPFRGTYLKALAKERAKNGRDGSAQLDTTNMILREAAARNAEGHLADKELQKFAKGITGLELVRMKVPTVKHGSPESPEWQVWAFHVPSGHQEHPRYLDQALASLGDVEEVGKSVLGDYWLAVPLSAYRLATQDDETLDEVVRETECCAHAVIDERFKRDPQAFLQKMTPVMESLKQGMEDIQIIRESDPEYKQKMEEAIKKDPKRAKELRNASVVFM